MANNWNNLLDRLKVSVGPVSDAQYIIEQLGKGTNTFGKSDAANVSTIYTCIEIKSDTMARLPLNVKQESVEGETIEKNDPLHYMLHYQPNSYTNAFNFWWTLEYYRNLTGNSYAQIIRQNGSAVSLKIIHPYDVIGHAISNGQIYYSYFEHKQNGERKDKATRINSDDMLHFTFGSIDGITGIDPISKLMSELGIKVKAGKTLDNLYTNNALNKALVLPQTNNESVKKQIGDFNSATGVDTTGRLRQLPFGSQLVDMSLDLNAVQFIESQKFTVTQIAALYRVPAHMLGILEQTKFSSVESMTIDFKTNSISPIAKLYKRELESKLLTKQEILGGKVIEFNTNALIETDLETKNKILIEQVKSGLLTPNKAAQVLGYAPWEDGGDSHWMPSSALFGDIRHKSDMEKLDQLINPKDFTPKKAGE